MIDNAFRGVLKRWSYCIASQICNLGVTEIVTAGYQ